MYAHSHRGQHTPFPLIQTYGALVKIGGGGGGGGGQQ